QHMMDEIMAYLALTPLEWVISCLYVLVFVTGVSGNFLVCYAVWRNKYLRTITNCFLTNLAVADFLTIVFCLPPSFAQTIFETWFLGRALCKTITYLQVSGMLLCSRLPVGVICVRWKWSQFSKFYHHDNENQHELYTSSCILIPVHILLILFLLLSPSLTIRIPNRVFHDSLIPPNLTVLLTSCAPHDLQAAMHYEIFLVVTFFLIPILVMGYNYTAIAVCLWSSSNTTRYLSEGDQQAIVSQLMARRRTAKMLVVVVVVFFFCFMPNYVWNILRHTVLLQLQSINHLVPAITLITQLLVYTNSFLREQHTVLLQLQSINHLVPAITLITQLLVYTNSCTNPIIYNFMSGELFAVLEIGYQVTGDSFPWARWLGAR
ncbi:hypothetical protein EGW08_014594, partial [Elysia chlorotica]